MFDSIVHPHKRAFLAAFAECGNVSEAAELAGISRESHYDWKAQDADYAEAFAAATAMAADALEDIAVRRAKSPMGDGLLKFLLQGLKPERYGRKVDLKHSGAIAHRHSADLSALTDDELTTLAALARKAAGPASDRSGDTAPEDGARAEQD